MYFFRYQKRVFHINIHQINETLYAIYICRLLKRFFIRKNQLIFISTIKTECIFFKLRIKQTRKVLTKSAAATHKSALKTMKHFMFVMLFRRSVVSE
jgi:hypothetical protein